MHPDIAVQPRPTAPKLHAGMIGPAVGPQQIFKTEYVEMSKPEGLLSPHESACGRTFGVEETRAIPLVLESNI